MPACLDGGCKNVGNAAAAAWSACVRALRCPSVEHAEASTAHSHPHAAGVQNLFTEKVVQKYNAPFSVCAEVT